MRSKEEGGNKTVTTMQATSIYSNNKVACMENMRTRSNGLGKYGVK